MPKKAQYQGLRARVRKTKSGKVWTGYYYCAPGQKKELPLGTDFEAAIAEWDRIHNKVPLKHGTLAEAFDRFEREVLPTKGKVTGSMYKQHLKTMRPVFDPATWDTIKRPILQRYMDQRSAKPQGVKEIKLLGYIWECARTWGYVDRDNPIRGWRIGKALVREVEVSDEAFNALYAAADSLLRDVLDIVTAIGIRLKDVLKAQLTDIRGDVLLVKANKTGKVSEFIITGSVLEGVIAKRRQNKKALHFKLLTTENGREVTETMMSNRWERARALAAKTCPEVKDLYLRDMRKRASNLAETTEHAAQLLQHSDKRLTTTHYRTRGERVKPVR